MLTYKEIHLLIEQGVNGFGMFTEQANLHEQVDLIINHIVEKHIRDLKDTPVKGYSTLEKNLVRFLNKQTQLPLTSNGRYYSADLPDDLGQLSNSFTILGLCNSNCSSTCCHKEDTKTCKTCSEAENKGIKEGLYYQAVTKVKYNNVWYNEGDLFKGVYSTDSAYGTFKELGLRYKNNIESSIDTLDTYSLSALVKNSLRPLLAWDENKFYIYYDTCNNKSKELVLELGINYLVKYTDALGISWCNQKTLSFPSDIQRYYIDLAIAYIATINKQDQQNIVNLKSETI